MTIQIYYHIFAADREQYFDVVKEQFEYIKTSPIYNKIEKINICLTGNHKDNYDLTLQYIKEQDEKFILRKCEFNDTTFERFTLNTMKEDIINNIDSVNNKYLYIHSKGGTTSVKQHKKPVQHWRRCMMYFLLSKGQDCLKKLDEYDTVGIFRHPTHHIPHYSGNFWWATGKYLRKLFSEFEIDTDYLGPEMYLFKAKPNSYDMYPMPNGYDGYIVCYPFELYKDYEIK